MPKCKKCGTVVSKDDIFCPVCREKITHNEKSHDPIREMMKTQDFTSAFSAEDINNNKIYALLCYIPYICLYPIIFVSKKSAFVKFHANSGLVLFIMEILISSLFFTIGVFSGFIPGIAFLTLALKLIRKIIYLLFISAILYGCFISLTGKAKEIPIISRIRIIR